MCCFVFPVEIAEAEGRDLSQRRYVYGVYFVYQWHRYIDTNVSDVANYILQQISMLYNKQVFLIFLIF